MIEEWDKLWEDKPDTLGDYIISDWGFEQWINRMERAGDKLIERVEYLDGLTDGDVKLITKLQVENEKLKHTIATGYCGECEVLKEENKQLRRDTKDLAELGSDDLKKRVAYQKENEVLKIVTAKLFNKLADEQKKLEAIRGIVAEYPKCDKNGLAFDWDELITRILAVLDDSAQNTDYVQDCNEDCPEIEKGCSAYHKGKKCLFAQKEDV